MSAKLLKLRAEDTEDVQVISAVLQDAIVPVCDMAFEPDTQSFVIVAQRLRREEAENGAAERICSALTVKGVTSVQTFGFDRRQRERMLDLLAIMIEPGAKQASLIFAGDARIRLELAEWGFAVEDFGAAWPALCKPCHEDAGAAQPRNP